MSDDKLTPLDNVIITDPGEPLPDMEEFTFVMLSNGQLVTEKQLGHPPPGLTPEERDLWYENREDELMFGDENDVEEKT